MFLLSAKYDQKNQNTTTPPPHPKTPPTKNKIVTIDKTLPTYTQIAFQIINTLAVLLISIYLESTKIIFHERIQLVIENLLVGLR